MDIGDVCFGFILGFASLFGLVAYAIKKDDGTTILQTLGEFLKELGTAIARNHKTTKI